MILLLTGHSDEKTEHGINILLLAVSAQDQRRRLTKLGEQWAWPPEWLCSRIQVKTSTPDVEHFYWASSGKAPGTGRLPRSAAVKPTGCEALRASYSLQSKHPARGGSGRHSLAPQPLITKRWLLRMCVAFLTGTIKMLHASHAFGQRNPQGTLETDLVLASAWHLAP